MLNKLFGKKERIAMFGGTYDPIHYGHISLAKCLAEKLELDRMYIIPARTPPHKAASTTPGEQRLEMCRLAIDEMADNRMVASDIELKRDGLSYSFYTVCALRDMHPGCEFFLMVGADNFLTIESWHRFHELKKLATFCTVCRDGATTEQLRRHAQYLESDVGCSCRVIEFDEVPISSTEIRRRVREGESIDGMTPQPVIGYIRGHRLYLPAAQPTKPGE